MTQTVNKNLSNKAIKLLRKAAGDRLMAQRKEQGYRTPHEAWKAMSTAGVRISYYRYQRLESGSLPNNELEMFGVSRFLDIGLDCWLEGFCRDYQHNECERMKELPPKVQVLFKEAFDGLVTRVNDLGIQ